MEEVDQVRYNSENYAAEKHKVSLMRTFVEQHDPASKEVDDLMLRRFLRSRNLNVEKAGTLFLKYLKWKRTLVPNGYVSEEEIKHDLSHNKVFLGAQDKQGRPILVKFGGRHYQNPKPGGLDEFKRLIVYTLDKVFARMPEGQETFLAIVDLQGWGYSNSDIRGYLAYLSCLQDTYPERLGKLLIVHSPYIFMTVWKIISPFIDERTMKKIQFVDKQQIKPTMLEYIDESQVPDIYGGKFPLVPIQEA